MGAHWDPTARKWYTITRGAFLRCKHWWIVPLDRKVSDWLKDPISEQRYHDAMQQWHKEHHPSKFGRDVSGENPKQ